MTNFLENLLDFEKVKTVTLTLVKIIGCLPKTFFGLLKLDQGDRHFYDHFTSKDHFFGGFSNLLSLQ